MAHPFRTVTFVRRKDAGWCWIRPARRPPAIVGKTLRRIVALVSCWVDVFGTEAGMFATQ